MKKVKELKLKKESIIALESKEMSRLMGGGRESRYDCETIYYTCGEPTHFTGITGETDCCPYGCCQTDHAYCGG